jgi:hypothetical protein
VQATAELDLLSNLCTADGEASMLAAICRMLWPSAARRFTSWAFCPAIEGRRPPTLP